MPLENAWLQYSQPCAAQQGLDCGIVRVDRRQRVATQTRKRKKPTEVGYLLHGHKWRCVQETISLLELELPSRQLACRLLELPSLLLLELLPNRQLLELPSLLLELPSRQLLELPSLLLELPSRQLLVEGSCPSSFLLALLFEQLAYHRSST